MNAVARLLLALLISFPVLVAAATPRWDASSFRVTEWGVSEGLPGNHVSALAQDADGFLWLATLTGVVRFDGATFQTFDASGGELPSSRFTALDIGPSGRLWLGSEQGHLIVREGGHFRVVVPPHYPNNEVGEIAEAADGSVWFTQGLKPHDHERGSLFHWVEDQARLRSDLETQFRRYPQTRDYTALDEPGGTLTLENRFPEMVLVRDAEGSVWARAFAGSSVRLADGLADPLGPGATPVLMLADARLLARSGPDGVDILPFAGGAPLATLPNDAEKLRAVWLRDRRGLLWVSTTDGLEAWTADAATPLLRLPLDTLLHDMIEDTEGNLWLATRTRGLLRLAPNPVRQIGGIPRPSWLALLQDGSAIMGTQLLDATPGSSNLFRLLPDAQPPEPGAERALSDFAGTRWALRGTEMVGTRADGSTWVLDRHAGAMVQDPHHRDRLWGSGETGFFSIRVSVDAAPQIEAEWPILAQTELLFDDSGLWVGTAQGLCRIEDDRLQRFGRDQGLPVDDVRALYRDDTEAIWIATYGGGLVHYDGERFSVIDQRHGLVENALSGIVADDFGALWLAGNRGIQRVLMADLRAHLADVASRVPSTLFGREHGIDNPETTGARSAIASGNTLYFSTFGGLVAIDPALVAERERQPPQVHALDASGDPLAAAAPPLTLADGLRDLRLRYTAIHLAASETLRFRHRLLGWRDAWAEADGEREVEYTHLHPGSYQLELQARHSGGPWVSAGVLPSIEVLPLWWETRAAQALALLALIGLGVMAWRLANRQIRQRALALEALVEERTAALAQQTTRMQELAEGRARFMSGISHELRTPLSLILAPLADLHDGSHGELPDGARDEIARVRRNAQRLLRLVERLLEVARVESGGQTLHCTEADLGAAIRSLVEQLQPLAEERGSTLQAQLPEAAVPVWFDPLLLESVLINLMVNGLKHTAAGSTVAVELDAPGADGRIELRVRDNGSGIPADALPHLFERFFRVRGEHASGADGFGLGLPLVREVIERHGGSVEVHSSDAGTCFTLRLRRGRAHLAEADIASTPIEPKRQASLLALPEVPVVAEALVEPAESEDDQWRLVLVVDDNADLRRLVRSYLAPLYRVGEADTGASGLAAVAEQMPDLIVSDVMMPVMDGFELCRALRAKPETDFIPILLLTAKAGLDYRIEGLEGGADAFLAKPFDRRELVATVNGLIASRQRLQVHYLQGGGESGRRDDGPPEAERLDSAAEGGCRDGGPPGAERLDGAAESGRRDGGPPTSRDVGSESAPSQNSRYSQRLTAVIESRLADEGFDVDALATAMAQDRSTLYRTVKAQFGVTPSELLRETRLQRAQAMLERGEGNVSEVAYAVGFRTLAHFSTSFHKRFGRPPSRAAGGGTR
jgi:signal transduction histidine kinase/CheY-like chemotaxis protein/AraC-like DNA-binding protein